MTPEKIIEMSRRILDVSRMRPGLFERACPCCRDLYLTSTSERSVVCSDCVSNAEDTIRFNRDVERRMQRRRVQAAIQPCYADDCDHCYRLESEGTVLAWYCPSAPVPLGPAY